MTNIPIVTVTCFRDLALLDLQAQSINLYLDKDIPVYIVVNEDDTSKWFKKFNDSIRKYYQNHKLTILSKNDFTANWNQWIPSQKNPWAVGWETQQILKLTVSSYIDSPGYLVLDSQNFLIKPWDYSAPNNTVPYRLGRDVMPPEIWEQYASNLNVSIFDLNKDEFSTTTPIFLNSNVTKSLIAEKGTVSDFANWFKSATRIKSEFILYRVWMEKIGGLDKFHYNTNDWAQPYLRDSRTNFIENLNEFLDRLGKVESHSWASINHRSWGDMTNDQYNTVLATLKGYGLSPDFNEYRINYVDYKF
jgi:Family of unknown function (DUF6492)